MLLLFGGSEVQCCVTAALVICMVDFSFVCLRIIPHRTYTDHLNINPALFSLSWLGFSMSSTQLGGMLLSKFEQLTVMIVQQQQQL